MLTQAFKLGRVTAVDDLVQGLLGTQISHGITHLSHSASVPVVGWQLQLRQRPAGWWGVERHVAMGLGLVLEMHLYQSGVGGGWL